ncbi:hypothetical protein [Paenibacillus sp. Marseille-Q4541]|uniref:hypothetical protein n=1 Tax=Paenibacillus sp. Marseille-Q4541 TaxID=2831522 RepID=UPI001BA63078|nr:hypothetical protein [Paenibacillus sp. Marseille-Q4541]
MEQEVGTGYVVTLRRILSGDLSEIMWNDYVALALYLLSIIWLLHSLYVDMKRYLKRSKKKREGMSEIDIALTRWEHHSSRRLKGYIDPGIVLIIAGLFRSWYTLF